MFIYRRKEIKNEKTTARLSLIFNQKSNKNKKQNQKQTKILIKKGKNIMSLELPIIHDGGKPRYPRIVLFQNGLGTTLNSGFNQTIKNIINYSKKDAAPLIIDNTSESLTINIDMSSFNPTSGAFATTADQNLFNSKISRIYELANANLGKSLLVETYLAGIYGTSIEYDSIENQKVKLIKIIDALHAKGNVEIFLVGHSQGGLVNLETAIERSSKIARMVSISTPYAPVDFARVDCFFKALILGLKSPLLSTEKERQYKNRLETLSSDEYYTQLKSKWTNLSPKPMLTVITGSAGTFSSEEDPDKCEENAFDGLVKVDEQKSINYASFVNFIDEDSPCYDVWDGSALRCINSYTCDGKCNSSCKLIKVSVGEAIVDVIKSAVEICVEKLSSNSIDPNDPLADYPPIIRAIILGLGNVEISNCPAGYEKYYRVAACPYNHYHIRYTVKTIQTLFEELTAY